MIQPPTHLCRALRGPGKVDYLVWMVSLGGAICYPLLPFGPPVPTSFLVAIKAAGVGMLALLVFRQAGRRGRSLDTFGLGVALSLSCLGDVFLALRVRNGFVYGLSSFLAAHLIYFALFSRRWLRPLHSPLIRLGGTAALLIFSVFFFRWLAPGLGELALPVMIYVCAITLMVTAALWAHLSTRLAVIGAILFMVSDSILAVDRFRGAMALSGLLIWTTYYLGQYGITMGFLTDFHDEEEK